APGVAVEAEAAAGRLRGGEVGGGGGRRRRPDEPGVDVLRLAGRDLRVARARQRTFVGGGDAAGVFGVGAIAGIAGQPLGEVHDPGVLRLGGDLRDDPGRRRPVVLAAGEAGEGRGVDGRVRARKID